MLKSIDFPKMTIKRLFDISIATLAAILLILPFLAIAIIVRLTSEGPILYWSHRIGKNNTLFLMPKFRTMWVDTPVIATHLLDNPENVLTPIGSFLRKSSLDELPQIWTIIKGDMSFVGPRPALFNQDDLIAKRTYANIHKLTPGLTGWAQINGRDELPIPQKVVLDSEYMYRQSFWFDLQIILLTFLKVLRKDGITH
jgi:O-antigen biosynthesis protein WbqP